jgi:hypothetical protein
MGIIITIIIKIGVIIGIIIRVTIGIVAHDTEIIILIVLLPLGTCNPISIPIILIMVAIGVILVILCPKILQIRTKVGLKCLMVIQTKACQLMGDKSQVG